ncbi:MAG: tocopherol cyclase family protein [Bacillota bacterium]|nr:tocopherol cyclase family protein [Bacillota bacterium]
MKSFFYGWYFKCQSDTQTFAIIPAIHQGKNGRTCSIQIITDTEVQKIVFSSENFCKRKKSLFIGKNQFGQKGIRLDIDTEDLKIKGVLKFRQMSPLKYNIMGPFVCMPFMECRHQVWSMRHLVNGKIIVNKKKYIFSDGLGYWEGDEGYSFPREYVWTQCFFQDGSLMLAVADIPIFGIHFTGIIGVVLWKGKEYRIATYLGARAAEIKNRTVKVIQRGLKLEAQLLEDTGYKLQAPVNGSMVRHIRESVTCHAHYKFIKSGVTLFDFETKAASFEYEYGK